MGQSAFTDGQFFDLPPSLYCGPVTAEADVSRREVAETFVIAAAVVALDEGADASLEVARQIVVLEQDAGSSGSDVSARYCDGTETLRYAIASSRPMGADVRQPRLGDEFIGLGKGCLDYGHSGSASTLYDSSGTDKIAWGCSIIF